MDHGLAEVLGARAFLVVGQGNAVGCPVILHDVGVIDRYVGRTLLEVLHRLTALSHDVQDERVRLVDGLARSVHEPLLRGPPGDDVALAALRS